MLFRIFDKHDHSSLMWVADATLTPANFLAASRIKVGMAALLTPQSIPTLDEFHAALRNGGDRWYAASLKITRNPALAEDAVQDGLLTAWNKREQFQYAAQLETWIHRIVINAALQLLRKQRPRAWMPLEDDGVVETVTPFQARVVQEMDRQLASSLAELSEFERVCFVLKHIEQWRLSEVAEELGTAVSNVKQGLFRAVRKLRVGMAEWRSEQ